ncbi:uncharacterized protein Neto [Chelonus insularis]|uniref:uncharacterized protein Neto n=1 Tax=Chelonus insularis TaxID=460826 RepID=UPI0015899987|nr:uncharacterized protein LOC118073965 [Chelonus insularis]XP_034950673.1 uncharacterized protein LOC118073965 [Chelonus insularis]XP_034950675.1 uncharacterized protein LOC118073965 [Chelonus insularis]
MRLPRAFVIVIVKSRDEKRARFKYINEREESTMVARLPQQVLLLLVLVTGATSGTYTTKESNWHAMTDEKNSKLSDNTLSTSSKQKLLKSLTVFPNKYYPNTLSKVSNSNIRLERTNAATRINLANSQVKMAPLLTSSGAIGDDTGLQVDDKERKAAETYVEEDIEKTISPITDMSTKKKEKLFQSLSIQLDIPDEIHLTRLNGSRQTEVLPKGIGKQAMRESSSMLPAGIEKYEKINARGLDATTKSTAGNPTPFSLRIQLDSTGTISSTDVTNPLLPDQPVIEDDVKMLSHPTELHSSTHSLQFQSKSTENHVMLVPSSITSPAKTEAEYEHAWLSDQSNTSLLSTQHSTVNRWLQFQDHESTLPTTVVGPFRRYMRDAPKNLCEKFEIGDDAKREFYSPNYPQNYPPSVDCVRVLEADRGMLIKLDFRDHFELESAMPIKDNKDSECRFDFLEVRDGQHGFSTPIGNYCDKNFPPEITSKSRYLWLRFHSDETIEYKGFKAVWSMVPRPTYPGVSPEPEPCIRNVTDEYEAIISSADVEEEKKIAEKNGMPLDCLWVVTVKEKWRMQLGFDVFKLDKPNDCDANFLSVFNEKPEMPSLLRNFCGSIAEAVVTKSHIMYIRFYVEPKAINSTFTTLMTAVRDKESNDASCEEDEYDCDDATCIAGFLRCNNRENCRLKWDEDPSICGQGKGSIALDSTRIVIILVIFSMIMFGMCFAFIFNCVQKLIRDHRIIQEHIRQSRENRLDEIGRKATPCPISSTQTDIRQRSSESPSLEIDSSKELIPPTTLIAQEYTKELVLEMNYGTTEINDIHQSNNVSNATQERLQESTEEPEMCDSSCQTRESLFDPRIVDPGIPSPAFSTFGYRSATNSQNGVSTSSRKSSQGQLSRQSPKQISLNSSGVRRPSEQCSICSSTVRQDSGNGICPKHTPIPAPPGWSVHEPPYSPVLTSGGYTESDYPSYQRYQSPKPERVAKNYQESSLVRQATVGSSEKYGGSSYGSGRGSNNTASNAHSSPHSGTPKYSPSDPRYRAEAVIEVDQKRPFSIESTKSAPDVIATH